MELMLFRHLGLAAALAFGSPAAQAQQPAEAGASAPKTASMPAPLSMRPSDACE